jgi:chromosome segregation ATPase
MRRMSPIPACLACAVLLVSAGTAPAQTKSKTTSTQQARQELDAAKDKLKDANQDLNKAEKEFDMAKAAHDAAEARIAKARAAALAEHGKKLGLPTAIAQRDAALRSVEAAQTALSKEFRAQADYQAAAKEAEQASTRLQSLRDDKALSEEKRKQLTAELSKTIRRPAELERERIEADAGIQRLRAKAAEAGRQVALVQAQAQKAAEEDTDVKAAEQAERDAAEKVKSARTEVDKHKKEVAAAQKKATTEQQQLQKAQSQAKSKKGKNEK